MNRFGIKKILNRYLDDETLIQSIIYTVVEAQKLQRNGYVDKYFDLTSAGQMKGIKLNEIFKKIRTWQTNNDTFSDAKTPKKITIY